MEVGTERGYGGRKGQVWLWGAGKTLIIDGVDVILLYTNVVFCYDALSDCHPHAYILYPYPVTLSQPPLPDSLPLPLPHPCYALSIYLSMSFLLHLPFSPCLSFSIFLSLPVFPSLLAFSPPPPLTSSLSLSPHSVRHYCASTMVVKELSHALPPLSSALNHT